MSNDDRMNLPPVDVPDLRKTAQQRAQQKMQFVQSRAQTAFTLLGSLLALEKQTPKLSRCRELINLAFAAGDYFNTQAVAPLKEDEQTIVKDG